VTDERLRAELARSERLRHAYEEIILTIGSSLTLQELLDRVVGIVSVAVGSTGAYLYLWDADDEQLVLWATTEGDKRRYLHEIQLRLGEGLVGWVAAEREAVILEDAPVKDARFKNYEELSEERFKSAIVVPVLIDKQARVGVIALWSRRRAHFGAEQLGILGELASVLAEAIARARLDEEARRRARTLSFLGDLWARFSMPRPLGELMGAVAEATNGVLESDACAIVLVDDDGRFVVSGMAPAREDLPGDALGALAARFEVAASAPLLAGSNHLGFVSCYRQRRFSSADRELLALIAGQLAFGLRSVDGSAPETDAVGELLRTLAAGKNDAAALSVAAALGVDLTRPHVLVQARLLPKDPSQDATTLAEQSQAASETFVRVARAAGSHAVFQRFAGGILGLTRVTAAFDAPAMQRTLQTLADEVTQRHAVSVSVGLSSVQESPTGYADAFREAAEALEIGAKIRGDGHVVRFDELGPYVYLFRMAADPRAARDPWIRSLLPLTEYDSRKNSELLETLDTYLDCGGNVTLTAERLHLHRNTLRQRLDRIERLTRVDLARTEDWLPLHLAVKLARLRQDPG
jgi:GAF domain-containing protein